jgi:hypothetical protein
MNPYQYLNSNNQQTSDLSYNQNAKALIDSLMGGTKLTNDTNQMMYQPDETGMRSDIPRTDQNGNILYIDNITNEPTTSPYAHTYLNGYEASNIGDNKYSISVDDPTSRGLFDVNVQVDPLTNKVSNLGTIYRSRGNNTQWYAPLTMAGMVAAPYLAPELFSSMAGAEAGGTVAGDAFLPGALATTDAGVASGISADLAAQGITGATGIGATGGSSGVGLGTGTSLSSDASSNILNGFYGTSNPTIQANLGTVSNLVGGGAESNLASLGGNYLLPTTAAGIGGAELGATGGIIGSGVGLGQNTVSALTGAAGLNGFTPNDFMSQPASDYNLKLPQNKSKTPQQNMANALRLPTGVSTSPNVYRQQNPFYFSPQQQLANMLKV